jgi:hypothetical protein
LGVFGEVTLKVAGHGPEGTDQNCIRTDDVMIPGR